MTLPPTGPHGTHGPELRALRGPEERLLARVAAHDGTPAISDDPLRAAARGEAPVWRVGPEEDPHAVAIAADTGERWALEFTVDPERRRGGIGAGLADRALADLAGQGIDPWAWSHGDHPAARRIAEHRGWHAGRTLLQLRTATGLTAESYPAVTPPEGIAIRTFRVGRDEAEWQRVNNAAFAWHPEQGNQDLDALRAEAAADDFDPSGFFLATPEADPDTVLGFHQTKIDAAEPRIGEVYVVGVHPDQHGRGLGSLLTAVGLHSLVARGVDQIKLYVEGDNDAALAVYRKLGFTTHTTDVSYTH